tara:strand:- start:2507 stop:3022 length:516 start_codon:yes stop_codon:yes gene_type:complete
MFNEELYLRKLRAEYEFRVVEAQYSNYIFKEALLEFQKEFAELSSKQQEDISPQRIKKKKKLSKTTDKLYKKIASIVHPDKRGGDNEDFKKLRTAIEEDDMEMVESIAEKHNIDIAPVVESVEFYEQNIKDLKNKVTQQSSMLAMVWHEATSEEKTELRHKIVDHYGGNNG